MIKYHRRTHTGTANAKWRPSHTHTHSTLYVRYAAPSISQMIFFLYNEYNFRTLAVHFDYFRYFPHNSTRCKKSTQIFKFLFITYAVSGIFTTIFRDDDFFISSEKIDCIRWWKRSALTNRTFKLKLPRMVYCVSNHVFFLLLSTRFSFCLCSCTVYAQCTRDFFFFFLATTYRNLFDIFKIDRLRRRQCSINEEKQIQKLGISTFSILFLEFLDLFWIQIGDRIEHLMPEKQQQSFVNASKSLFSSTK